jgi:hypothetical protein
VIRRCLDRDFEAIYLILNDAAQAYKNVIPQDRWKDPYMSRDELRREINEGVVFWGYEEDGRLLGVMGTQDVEDVSLVRHAYVCTRTRTFPPICMNNPKASEWVLMVGKLGRGPAAWPLLATWS